MTAFPISDFTNSMQTQWCITLTRNAGTLFFPLFAEKLNNLEGLKGEIKELGKNKS